MTLSQIEINICTLFKKLQKSAKAALFLLDLWG